MFGFGGLSELMFIFFLAMLIFGPEKLPEIGRMLAKGMAEVRKASNELKRTLNAELAISEQEIEARRRAAASPPIALAPMAPMAPAPVIPVVPEPVAADDPFAWPSPASPAAAPVGAVPSTLAEAPVAAEPPTAGQDAVAVPVDEAAAHEAPAPAQEASEASMQADGEGYEPRGHGSDIGHAPLDDRSDIVPEPR